MATVLCVLYDDPVGGYPPAYARDGVPKIDSYHDGSSTPTPEAIDFTPGDLLGSVSGELGLRSEAGEARGEAAVAPASSEAGHGRTRIPRNRHTRSRVDPDETTKADLVGREGRRPWLLAHGKAELAEAVTRAQ